MELREKNESGQPRMSCIKVVSPPPLYSHTHLDWSKPRTPLRFSFSHLYFWDYFCSRCIGPQNTLTYVTLLHIVRVFPSTDCIYSHLPPSPWFPCFVHHDLTNVIWRTSHLPSIPSYHPLSVCTSLFVIIILLLCPVFRNRTWLQIW